MMYDPMSKTVGTRRSSYKTCQRILFPAIIQSFHLELLNTNHEDGLFPGRPPKMTRPSFETPTLQSDMKPSLIWNSTEVLIYVRKIVHGALRKEISDDENILAQECVHDNNPAAWVGNSLSRAVLQTHRGVAGKISQQFVIENPTIARLAERLLEVAHAVDEQPADKYSHRLQHVEAMVSELSTNYPQHRPRCFRTGYPREVVLLTGTTGALGSQLLTYLASIPEVSHVYAFNRRSSDGKSLRDRQAEVLLERGLDVSILDSQKVTLVEGDTEMANLDIDPVLFSHITDSTTLIIHNAWNVNFLAGFKSFKSNMRSVRTLIDLALRSPRMNPPRIMFTSSVTIFKNWNARYGRPLEAQIEDPTLALGCGYGESKLVAERILEDAARSTPLRPIIVRIGQLTGAQNGIWSSNDWVPIFVMSGQLAGALPARNDCITWLSPQIAAKALFDFRNSESQYLHLAHPNPVPWASVFGVFASQLNVPLVCWDDWMLRVEERFGGIPVFRFFDIFRNWVRAVTLENREAPGVPMMDMRKALKCSPSLTHPSLPQVSPQDAERWIRYWRRVGTITSAASDAKL